MAAAREGRAIDFKALVTYCEHAIGEDGRTLFIEGVGGVMVPLDPKHTVLDWMKRLGLPVLLVTGSYLGTISHTLTALEVLARAGLSVRMLILNESAGATVPLSETRDTLERFVGAVPIATIPRDADARGAFANLADRLA
jgi:dethiobiotin synthetase